MTEATAISPEGRISPWDTGIWNTEQAEGWREVTKFIKKSGALAAIQLAHAGRKASIYREWSGTGALSETEGGWEPVSSTDQPFPEYNNPRELSTSEVEDLVISWVEAASRAVEAGFDLIEIHAAHGYLIHQFLSPITNQRTDRYGGSKENRARFLLEIVGGMRAAIGENIPIAVRFSATDYRDDGFTLADCSEVASWCEIQGADLFDISSGGLILGVSIPFGPGYQVPLAQTISNKVESPVATVGLITTGSQAEEILQTTKIEIIMIGRASLRDPYWPLRAAFELAVDIDYWPKQYTRGMFKK